MFFDPIGWTASRSSFTPETPSELINCYLVFALVRRTAQFESRRNRGASATDDSNSDRLLFGQTISSQLDSRCALSRKKDPICAPVRQLGNVGMRPVRYDCADASLRRRHSLFNVFSRVLRLRVTAREFKIPGGEERIVYRAHVDIPGVRADRARSRHRGYRGVPTIEIGIDHSDLEKPAVGIYRDAGARRRSIFVSDEVHQRLPQCAVAVILIRSGDKPAFRIDVQYPLWNSHSGVGSSVCFNCIQMPDFPILGAVHLVIARACAVLQSMHGR